MGRVNAYQIQHILLNLILLYRLSCLGFHIYGDSCSYYLLSTEKLEVYASLFATIDRMDRTPITEEIDGDLDPNVISSKHTTTCISNYNARIL